MNGRWHRWALALLAVAPAAPTPPAAAQWQPDDRVIIADFGRIVGVAGDGRRIHAATANGLIGYDPATGRWLLPLTVEDGYPVMESPSALAWAPGEQALLLGTRAGGLWRVDAAARSVDRLTGLPGSVLRLAGGETGELYAATPGGWLELAPGTLTPRPVAGVPAAARERADGALAALRGTLGLDAHLRRWPLTAVAAGFRAGEYYVGTDGGGLLQVDALTLAVTPLPFGLPLAAATAVARLGEELWFGGVAAARGRASVGCVRPGLEPCAGWWDPVTSGAPAGTVAALAVVADELWAAASDGLFRLGADRSRWHRLGTRDGLPDQRATALAQRDSLLWIGTMRGACLWLGASCGPALLPGETIGALAYCGGALWLGTGRGLWRATGDGIARVEPPGITAEGVRALACVDEMLYVGAPGVLVRYGQGGWLAPLPLPGPGTARSLAAGVDDVWVGMDGGLANWDPATARWSGYVVPADVPAGPVMGVLPAGEHLWLATPAGAVRLEPRHR